MRNMSVSGDFRLEIIVDPTMNARQLCNLACSWEMAGYWTEIGKRPFLTVNMAELQIRRLTTDTPQVATDSGIFTTCTVTIAPPTPS